MNSKAINQEESKEGARAVVMVALDVNMCELTGNDNARGASDADLPIADLIASGCAKTGYTVDDYFKRYPSLRASFPALSAATSAQSRNFTMAQPYAQYKRYPANPGWYCLGFDRLHDQLQADIGPNMQGIYRFDGQDWYDEDGDKKEGTYDPELGIEVGMTGADYYVPN